MNTQTSSNSEVPSRDQLFQSCGHIACNPNILDFFIEELGRGGFAGEERASLLIYLGLTSRLFKDPVSIAVKGPSSAGKSHTVKEVLKFFPATSYYEMSAMSEKALAYMDEELKNRFLVVYEAEGMSGRNASYFIRSLLSEGCIKYKTLSQDSDGKWRSNPLYVEGPTGLLTTTTLVSLHAENETRLLSVSVNDSPEQTRRIMDAMVSEVENIELDYAPWHALQNWIAQGPTGVVIPFGSELAANAYAGAVRVRRDFPKLLSLIRAHALLHQESRDRREGGAVVATIEDYAGVRQLIVDLLAEAAEQGVSEAVRKTVEAVQVLTAHNPEGVSVSMLAKHFEIDKSSASRRCQSAVEQGYLQNQEVRKGFPAKFTVADSLPEEQTVLPTVEELLQCCSEKGGMVPILGTGTDRLTVM